MKILFVCHGIGNGGAERVVTVLANEFSNGGYDVGIVTMKKEKHTYPISKKIKYVPIETVSKYKVKRGFVRISSLRKIIKSFRPDCIISFSAIANIQTIIATRFYRGKLIISERTDPARHPTLKIAIKLRNLLYPLADICVFQTSDAKAYFKKKIQDKGVIIPNPLKSDLPESYQGTRSKIIVGIGSLGEQKNWMILLRAFELFVKDFDEYKLVIYGEGPDREELEKYVQNSSLLNHKVTFPGFESDIHNKVKDCAMYISCSDYEGISNSMLEALALGIPSICTDCPVGGARMFIKNNHNGILIPVRDINGLYSSMKKVVEQPEFAEMLSANSISIRNKLNIEKIFRMWEGYAID